MNTNTMTTETKNYNGWTNYETWNVALWLDNDQGSQEYWNEQAQECLTRAIDGEGNQYADTSKERAEMLLEDILKDQIEESAQNMLDESKQSSSMFADLLNSAISEVNFREIAEHYIAELEVFAAGYNMPGCLPDADPMEFTSFDDAKESIIENLNCACDELEEVNTIHATKYEEAVAEVSKLKGPFNIQVENFVYWITKL